jgi:hypothetical protein
MPLSSSGFAVAIGIDLFRRDAIALPGPDTIGVGLDLGETGFDSKSLELRASLATVRS